MKKCMNKKIRLLSMILAITVVFTLLATSPGVLASGTVTITAPLNNATVAESYGDGGVPSIVLSATVTDNPNSVDFYVDDEKVGTLTQATDDSTYSITCDATNIPLGTRKLKVVANYSNTTAVGVCIFNLTGIAKKPIQDGIPTEPQTFDTMSNISRTSDSATLEKFAADFGWRINSATTTSNIDLARTTGSSGKNNDYAPFFLMAKNDTSINDSKNNVQLDGFTEALTTGTLVMDFDLWLYTPNTSFEFNMNGIPTWSTTDHINNNRALYGANVKEHTFAREAWSDMLMEYDIDNQKWKVVVDGNVCVEDAPALGNDANDDMSHLNFYMQRWSGAVGSLGFGLDNFSIYLKETLGVGDKSYELNDATHSTTSAVPVNASNVKIELTTDVDDVLASDVTINGANVEDGMVTYNDRIVTITLPDDAKEGDTIKVELNGATILKNGTPIKRNISETFVVVGSLTVGDVSFLKDGEKLSSKDQISDGDKIDVLATITNVDDNPSELIMIVAVKNGKTFSGFKCKKIVVPANTYDYDECRVEDVEIANSEDVDIICSIINSWGERVPLTKAWSIE